MTQPPERTEAEREAARQRLSEDPEGLIVVRRSYEEEGDEEPALPS